MNPYDELYGAEPRRFLRMVYEFEIEVTDPTQLSAYNLMAAQDETGNLAILSSGNANQAAHQVVSTVLSRALHETGETAGFKWLSASILPRRIGADGHYAEMTFPPMPARRDDGSFPDEPEAAP